MKTSFLFLLSGLLLLAACNNFGTRVMYNDSEVFFKGPGVAEKDARQLGDYLQRINYFTGAPRSVQLTHNGSEFLVHLVVDQAKLNDTVKRRFWRMQHDLSLALNGRPTRIVLADNRLRDLEKLNPIALRTLGKSNLFYDSSALRQADVDSLLQFLVQTRLMGETSNTTVIYQKEKNVPTVRMVVNPGSISGQVLPSFSFVQETMRATVFRNRDARLVLTSAQLDDLPPLPELAPQQREEFWRQAPASVQSLEGRKKDSLGR